MMPKLLLIDDPSAYLILVEKILISEGFEVSFANDETKVQNYLQNSIPDVILIDVLMQNKNGFFILEKLREEYKSSIPIIVISAGKSVDIIKKAFNYGAYDYLIKPLNFKDLVNKISKALEKSEQHKRQHHV